MCFKKEQIDKINQSELFDKELKVFRTSCSLNNESKELGRICSFNPGWLERESDFIHMTFKYLLGLIKGGYFQEFFDKALTNIPCFMDPSIYGRSIFENVSFISTSVHPNKDIHGQGFYARLTGANSEIIDMQYSLLFGEHLFSLNEDGLTIDVHPHIPISLFKDDKIVISLFKDIKVIFLNKHKRDYNQQNNITYIIENREYTIVPRDIALKIREKEIKELTIVIN